MATAEMAKISDTIIQRVLDATDIVGIIGEFVVLRHKGARWIGLCPFHDDRHATNFVVYPAKKCYTCFACGAKGDVVKFLKDYKHLSFTDAIRYLGEKAKIDVDGHTVDVNTEPRKLPPPLPTLYLPSDMVRHSMQRRCNFHTWLCSLPWTTSMAERVEEVIEAYQVGATKQGFALFWQLDVTGTARTGHAMRYRDDGHRAKTNYSTDWVHAMLRREVVKDDSGKPVKDDDGKNIPSYPQYAEDKVEMRQTLFGMHLLDRYPEAEVHIVESEKTALICAIYFGDMEHHLWMACCGKYNLKREVLQPIISEHRIIALHPDKDGVAEWDAKRKEIGYERAYINNTILTLQWKPEDGDKADVADVLVRLLTCNRPSVHLDDINPAIKTLIK